MELTWTKFEGEIGFEIVFGAYPVLLPVQLPESLSVGFRHSLKQTPYLHPHPPLPSHL